MLIGREKEKQVLLNAQNEEYSQFIAVYGRRRVGKTFLIRETFENRFDFQYTGAANLTSRKQLVRFRRALKEHGQNDTPELTNWGDAFSELKRFIANLPEGKKIVFFDELPWMDAPRSGFLSELESFWNGWASARKDIVFVVCGSSTSWMVKKIIRNKGGLHNRLNHRILLNPFPLGLCEKLAQSRGIVLNRKQMLEAYMVFGGVPYYLSMLESTKSLAQNIDELLFHPDGQLHREYENLYQAMFRNADNHLLIVKAMAAKSKGLTRNEILEATGLPNAGSATRVLDELEQSDFVRRYTSFGQKKRDEMYQLTDAYTLFYFHFLQDGKNNDKQFWQHHLGTPKINSWAGYAFEQVCLAHVEQIKMAMGISGMAVSTSGWFGKGKEQKAQIDLVLDRADHIVNLCEIKFSTRPYTIDKQYAETLQNRQWIFEQETKTRKSCQQVMLTTYGLAKNQYSSIIQRELTMEDLFH